LRAEKGKPIESLGFIRRFVPSSAQPPTMTLLLLHGTGGNENSLIQLGRELSDNAALLSPRGQVLENGMPRFFRRIAEGVFDTEDLVLRTHELAAFVEAASKAYGFDTSHLIAVGYSNGANIASSLLLLHPKLLAGAILFRPMVSFMPENLPDLSGCRVLLAAGSADHIVPREQTRLLLDLLKRCRAIVTLKWQDGTHALVEGDVRFAREWLSKFPR
jgi:phospholipase/carboxylesterase/glyoxalase family protein